jgi:protein gp37
MGRETSIEWTHHTFNPWRGCAKVHAGCTHCYAEKNIGVRMSGISWGEVWQGGQRVVKADSQWEEPLAWARAAAKAGERLRVFCSSLADVLEVPEMPPFERLTTDLRDRVNRTRLVLDGARTRLWEVIRQTATVWPDGDSSFTRIQDRPALLPQVAGLDWLLLTKRPENWRLVPEDVRPLVWLGTSISNQETADEWVPRLLTAQGFRYRFLSVEPLVGPVDLGLDMLERDDAGKPVYLHNREAWHPCDYACGGDEVSGAVDWVIIGGESGAKARPCNVAWIRDLVRQCGEAGVPAFVKQLGAAPRFELTTLTGGGFHLPALKDKKGGDWEEWPADLRVRQLPGGAAP